MVRQVHVVVPEAKGDEVAKLLKDACHVHNFDTKSGKILHLLHRIGVGVEFGYTNLISLASCTPTIRDYSRARSQAELAEVKHRDKLAERIPLEEIHEAIESQNKLNLDYLIMCFLAAVIAAIGLLEDNIVVLVASMLLSPLMGPILAITLSLITRDRALLKKSVKNELVGVAISVVTGMVVALCIVWTDLESFPTDEMHSRGNEHGLIAGLAIAIPSGAGVALAVTGGTINPLVGVAISASVLPPLANAGLCLVLGIGATRDPDHEASELLKISWISMMLWLINIVAIVAMSMLFFWLKDVSSHSSTWKELHESQILHPSEEDTAGPKPNEKAQHTAEAVVA